MADEKDRYGEKLHDKAKVHADQWARQQDAELLEKLRNKATTAMHCPKCNSALVDEVQGGIHLQACPNHDGAWLDAAALKNLLKK